MAESMEPSKRMRTPRSKRRNPGSASWRAEPAEYDPRKRGRILEEEEGEEEEDT